MRATVGRPADGTDAKELHSVQEMATIDPVGFFGREFIGYVANCEEASVDAALGDPQHPAHARMVETVERCRALLDQTPLFGIYDYFAQRPDGRDTSTGNLLRLEAGGELPTPTTS